MVPKLWLRGLGRGGVLFALILAFGPSVRAIDVLVYDVNSELQTSLFAATDLGYTAIHADDRNTFITSLATGEWTLVAADVPSSGMDIDVANALADYVSAGGRVMLNYWNLGGATSGSILRGAFQIAATEECATPLDIYPWDASHDVWHEPNELSEPIAWFLDAWSDDGDRLTGAPGTLAVAGFVSAYDGSSGAVVIGNQGRTILNGFMPDSYALTDIAPFIVNEMYYLATLPEPLAPTFRRGDANGDAVFDVSDAVFTLAVLFVSGSAEPECTAACDANDDGFIDISDPIHTLAALFIPGSTPLPPPFFGCGVDPTPDELDCQGVASCL